ncbi:hypothetical protein V5F77_05540 [Xanthobacter sp. DSM 24535]|uniref:hypothetical protein n=1 Tax=Roseixanthobacter psychrophilus TaxID=3119917 RepID=UPI00372B6733
MRIALIALCGLVLASATIEARAAKANVHATNKPKSSKAQTPAETRVWSMVRGDGTYALRFSQPRAADPSFAATCQPSAQLLQIALEVNSTKINSGDGVALALSNGKRRLELAASAFLGSSDGLLVVEAAVSLEPRVFDIFRDGDTLTIKLAGQTQILPLAGARARLQDFERACLASR